jgi:hypothetical protein
VFLGAFGTQLNRGARHGTMVLPLGPSLFVSVVPAVHYVALMDEHLTAAWDRGRWRRRLRRRRGRLHTAGLDWLDPRGAHRV